MTKKVYGLWPQGTLPILDTDEVIWGRDGSTLLQRTVADLFTGRTFAGVNVAPTAAPGNNSTQLATTAYADAAAAAAKTYADGLVVGLWDDRGAYNASSNVYPSSGGSGPSGAIKKGDIWTISVAGTLGGTAVPVGGTVRALVDSPGSTSDNWALGGGDLGYAPLNAAANLADLVNAATARSNLGLGSMAIQASNAVAITGGSATLTAASIISAAGAISTPGLTISGAPFSGGSGTTTLPQLYLNSGSNAPSSWSTNGTVFGINTQSGFPGNLIDLHINGGSTVFRVSSTGLVVSAGGATLQGGTVALNASSNNSTNINTGTSTGTVSICGSSAKVSFFAATGVVQQNATGTSTGFTAGAGTGVTDQSTFTGGSGSTAYRLSDLVLALKNYGLLAA